MKSLKSKVMLSAIVLVFALVASIGSTYAWFTVSNTVNVESMTLNVQSSDSLLIKMYDDRAYWGAGGAGLSDLTTLDGQVFLFNGTPDPDEWTNNGDVYVLNAGNLVLQSTPANIRVASGDMSLSLALAQAAAEINDASSYFTNLTSAQVKLAYDYTNWTLAPVTAVQTGYAALDGDVLNVLTTPNTDYMRALSPIDVLGQTTDVNTATVGKVITLKFWMLSQGDLAKELHLNTFDVTASNALAVRDEVIDAVRLAITGNGADATIYGHGTADYDYEYITGLPGFQTGTPNTLAGGFNRIDLMTPTASHITLIEGDASIGTLDTSVITTLASNTPTIVTVTIYVEGWDAQATNNIIAADFNITFKFII